MKFLQRLGRSFMLPVAVLPVAAILRGIGYWIQNAAGENVVVTFLNAAGGALLDNMPILFAIGVSLGMAAKTDGTSALSGLVSWLTIQELLAPKTVALFLNIEEADVNPAFGVVNNVFIGIIAGLIGAYSYNRFKGTKLPDALSFFSGKRSVAIVSAGASLIAGAILFFIWPVVYTGLVDFGEWILGLGAFGAGLYGFFNRLLIPLGLHHALNSVFWFDVAGINDIPNFLGGAKSLAEGKAILGVTGIYQAGFFPIMMFGLPGAALAIYHAAKPENKERVASIMLAAAIASFFTGVTEPLEFSFMLVAPALYVVHALLTGISVFLAASFQWIAGFGFSAGLVDLVLSSRNPLALKWYMLIVQGLVFFALYYVVFRAAIRAFNLRTPGREADDAPAEAQAATAPPQGLAEQARAYLAAVGGNANLESIDACITRLRLVVRDMALVDEKQALRLGASGVVRLDARNVQIIVGPQAERIAQALREHSTGAAQPAPTAGAPVAPEDERPLAFIAALGGAANLSVVDACISRLRLTVADPARVDARALRQLGASGVVTLGAQNVQVIVGGEAEGLAAAIRRLQTPVK